MNSNTKIKPFDKTFALTLVGKIYEAQHLTNWWFVIDSCPKHYYHLAKGVRILVLKTEYLVSSLSLGFPTFFVHALILSGLHTNEIVKSSFTNTEFANEYFEIQT